ncbi:hypothetical protein F1880_001187 [Penicillium rolfsii]|nr:hypothetical protein F1880_001187 [Penicillium rolfsii]
MQGRQTGTKEDLVGREFLTHCPPDLPPRHRILALLGTIDKGDAASPSKDGWFISDFYLFHYLLSLSLPRPSNQIWLTCEDPEALVAKYHEYLHSDSAGDRSLRVVPRTMLLERYINTLQEQASIAADLGEHLVLLIFGNGTPEYGVEVGGSIMLTIFITSYYSSGWLVLPDRRQQLNATAITVAGPEVVSLLWPTSGSVGRASRSLAATTVLRCLVDAEDEIKERIEHPIYIQLAKSIYSYGLYRRDQFVFTYA